MRRRLPLVVAGWLITGLIATGAGVTVIGLLGEPLTTSALRPRSPAEIDEALARTTPQAAATPTSPSPSPSASTPPPAEPVAGRSGVIDTAGGNVIARCEDGLVTLRAWSPAQGFHVDKVERGPVGRARVEFESDEAETKVEVRCSADGSPIHRIHD
ncbi:hypothetical protein ACFQX6_27755 [Streptosporangium lutulentum]